MSAADQENNDNANKESQAAVGCNEAPPPYPGLPHGQPQPEPMGPPLAQPPKQPMYPTTYPPQPVPPHHGAPGPISQQPRPQPNTVVVHHYPQTTTADTVVVVRGNCPNCQVGTVIEDFTCLGIFLGIFFFPCGVLCCLMMRQRRCSHCGAFA